MAKRKIAETVNIRVNIGNYQHIEISKYAEEEIEYDTAEERIEKENKFTSDLLDNLVRNLDQIPQKVNKVEDTSILKVKESVGKAIPDWMKDNQEPNLAKKKIVQAEAEQTDQVEKVEKKLDTSKTEIDDLLGDSKDEPKKEEKVEVPATSASDNGDLFGDDDLF
jgi:hypothetical protein